MRVASADEERAIVGDEEDRAAVFAQEFLEPADRVDVEMVGRLIEQQHVRLRDERFRQQRAPAPAARQLADLPVGGQAEPRDHELDLLLDPPAVLALELLLQPRQGCERVGVVRLLRHRDGGVVIVGDERPSAPRPSAISSNTVRSTPPGTSWSSRETRSAGARQTTRSRAAARRTSTRSRLDFPLPLRPMTAMRSPGLDPKVGLARRAAGGRRRATARWR